MAKPFRSLETNTSETRKDDILRAAITAFVGLTNPGKRDANQIEDLALSILPFTAEATRRFTAAALSEKAQAPLALVKRLCEEPTDICAPLLLRSPVLASIDLVAIIGKMGAEHARVIACRSHLPNAVIEALALVDDEQARDRAAGRLSTGTADPMTALANIKPVSAEAARHLLRQIMVEADDKIPSDSNQLQEPAVPNFLPRETARKLVDLALREQEGLFVTALSDLSGLPFQRALKLIRRPSASELSTLLKSFEIDGPTSYLICSVFYPQITASRTEMRLFLDRLDATSCEAASAMVRDWKAEEISLAVRRAGANSENHSDRDLSLFGS